MPPAIRRHDSAPRRQISAQRRIVKSAVQRYSGLQGYRKLHNVALGVILGEFALETVWSIMAMVNRYATYSISINGRLGWNQ